MRLPTKLSRHLRRFARHEDGAMAIAMAGLLPLMFFMLTLVEASRVYGVKNQLQATADAAAMASVWKVHDGIGPVRQKAIDFAEYNMPVADQYGGTAVLVETDVEMGTWDADRVEPGPFDPAGAPADAVRVTTNSEMPLFFAGALRSLGVGAPDSFTPSARAIGLLRPDKCYSNGFVAGGRVTMNSSNDFGGNFCVYGFEGVTMTSSNKFAPGTEVGMADLDDLIPINGGNNPGLQEALAEKVVAAPAANAARLMIQDLLDGKGPMGLPQQIDSWPPTNGMTPGRLYHVLSEVDINVPTNQVLEDVGIISSFPINVKAGSHLSGVTLGSLGAVNIASNVEFGDASFCTTGEGQSIILSGGDVTGKQAPLETNSNIDLYGVQMISDGTIEMNSNLKIVGASIQSSGDIKFNSRFDVAGCPDGTGPSPIHGETKVSQLVD